MSLHLMIGKHLEGAHLSPARVQNQHANIELLERLDQRTFVLFNCEHGIEVGHDELGLDRIGAQVTDFLELLLHLFSISTDNANVEV